MLILCTQMVFMRQFVVFISLFVLSVLPGFAEEPLPKLPEDPAVSRGVLPNGISYILVANPAVRGVADVALLQRACQTEEELPESFLARKCVAPGRKGYVQRREDNLIYRFDNLPVAGGDNYTDSLLFKLMDLAGRSAQRGEPRYGTTGQTIIIAGDIDKGAIAYKLRLFSFMVPHIVSAAQPLQYSWEPGETLSVEVVPAEADSVAVPVDDAIPGPSEASPTASHTLPAPMSRISFEYRLPAMPRENNNSVATVVSDQFAEIFRTMLTSSTRRYLSLNGIMWKDMDFRMELSDTRLGDDVYAFTLEVPRDKVDPAVAAITSMLSRLVHNGVTAQEHGWAYDKFMFDRAAHAHDLLSNDDYVEKCIDAVLYNASLATEAEKFRFFSTKVLSDDLKLRHFNLFGASLGSEDRKLTVRVERAPREMDADSLRRILLKGQDLGCSLVTVNMSDTLSFATPLPKYKRPSIKKDVITGGQLYKYENGLKVVYKQMATNGIFHYSWLIPGGSDHRIDLRGSDVGLLSGDAFLNLLDANGITAEVVTSSKGIRIEGRFASARLLLFMKAMQQIFASHPEFGSPADGILILVGDRTQYSLEKLLLGMAGTFDTSVPSRKKETVNDVWNLDRRDTTILYESIYAVDYLYSAENMMVSRIARAVVKDALVNAFSGTGCWVDVRSAFMTSPRDMLVLDIKICSIEGRTPELSGAAAKTLVRETLNALASAPYPGDRVELAKTLLRGAIEKSQQTPQYWLTAARMRFTESKDMVSAYADKLARVTPENVRALLSAVVQDGPDELFKD